MNVVVLAAIGDRDEPVACEFGVRADGMDQPVVDVPPAFAVPDGASGIEIVAVPTTAAYWQQNVTLTVGPDGEPSPTVGDAGWVTTTTAELAGHRVTRVTVGLSRVRNVTTEAVAALRRWPVATELNATGRRERAGELAAFRQLPDWPPDWDTPARSGVRLVDLDDPISGGLVNTVMGDVDPECESLVLEVAGVSAPRLVSVSWPRALAPTEGDAPVPMLVYWRPGCGQNVEFGFYAGPGHEPYPFAFDYVMYGLLSPMRMPLDIYQNAGPKGVPYQVARAGRQVVSVLLCNAVGPEFGAFGDAASVEAVLLAVQRFFHRRAGLATAPSGLGPVGFAGFSSGNVPMAAFLGRSANRAHPFCAESLREVVFLDPPDGLVADCVRQADRWAGADEHRGIRLYTRGVNAAHRSLVGDVPAGPFVQNSATGRHTAGVLPTDVWHRSALAAGFPTVAAGRDAWQDAHQLIPAGLLAHAVAQGSLGT